MLLEMKHITKKYGDLLANDDISISLESGEILAIIGENGAGKTTIMKILYGLERANAGEIYLHGELQEFKNPSDSIHKGIGMVQQHFMLFEPFTVAENIVYSREPKKGLFMDMQKARSIVQELSQKYELKLNPDEKIEDMPVGLRQRVEILKVLYQNADIIIFDEPTAVLTPQEVTDLIVTIKSLSKMGKSIIIITHKLKEVMALADRAIVLRAGKFIAERKIEDTSIEELSYLMIGSQIPQKAFEATDFTSKVLEIKNLNVVNKLGDKVIKNLSLYVNAGEIVGIAGVSGNGQSELEQAILGLLPTQSGCIVLESKEISKLPVKERRLSGAAMIPEDRYKWGSATLATVMESGMMVHHRKANFAKHGIFQKKSLQNFVKNLVKDFNVKVEDIHDKTGSLSGGNAQKLIVGRELLQKTPLLVACEPTRGVDIGAMEYIHDKLLEKRKAGDAILLFSSELSEIMKLSDRIYVIYEGEIAGELQRGQCTEEEIGLLIAGGTLHEKNK